MSDVQIGANAPYVLLMNPSIYESIRILVQWIVQLGLMALGFTIMFGGFGAAGRLFRGFFAMFIAPLRVLGRGLIILVVLAVAYSVLVHQSRIAKFLKLLPVQNESSGVAHAQNDSSPKHP